MDAMNIVHAIRRALGWHPTRRVGEPDARSTAELVRLCVRDRMYGRRFDDATDVGAIRDELERTRKLTATSI